MAQAIETIDDLREAVEGFLRVLGARKADLVYVDARCAERAGLNEEIGRKQAQLAELENGISQILNKMHLRKEVA